MANHVATPTNFTSLRARTHRRDRRNHHWNAAIGVFVTTCSIAVVIGGLLWVDRQEGLGGPQPGPGAESASAALAAPARQRNTRRRSDIARPQREHEAWRENDAWRGSDSWQGAPQAAATGETNAAWNPNQWSAAQGGSSQSSNPFESDLDPNSETTIDELVLQRLNDLEIKPAKVCSDEVFLRRVYIDVLGTLPTVEEAARFLDDDDPDKRAKLIDQALERPEFADYWAMKWSDLLRVKAEFPVNLWPNAAQAYHRWIRTAIRDNLPYDQFARELLTASGSNFRTPQVNFYRAVQSKEPTGLAQAVALTFLGERAEQWPTERLEGLGVFFSQVGYKPTGEWKEEIVFFDRRKGKEPGNAPLTAVFPNGQSVQIPAGQDPRRVFADWLVDDKNPWFARVLANRVWCWLLGRGVVDPPDDIRADNPPSNLALLNHLAAELVAADYNPKRLYRLILNSQTYQLACIPASQAPRAAENFAYYPVRRLDAEVLIDAICQITATTETYSSIIPEPFTFLPDNQRAIALPDGSVTSSFLEMFGRPARDTGLESERNNNLTAAQALHLLNSNHLRNKLRQGEGIRNLLEQASDRGAAETLYLAILSRRPTDQELAAVSGLCDYPDGAREAAWALINSDEFLFRH